jgi:hypothetical protein
MHIDHITYDECRKPASTTRRAREFISSKLRRHSDPRLSARGSESAERPVTAWPTVPPDFSTKRPEVKTKPGEESKNIAKGEADKSGFRRSISLLRRKSCSAGSRDKELGDTKEWGDARGKCIERVRSIRKEIREGRLERAVHPAETFDREMRPAPLMPPALRTRSSFGMGEDNIYEPWANNFSMFQLPFNDPLQRSFSQCSSISIPETSPDPFMHTPENDKSQRSSSSSYSGQINISGQQTYLGGKGHNLWRPGPLDPCRLCKKGSVVGIRGLCRECEEDFVTPETLVFDPVDSSNDEVKPPPLKIVGMLAMRRSAARRGKEREDERVKRRTSFYEFWDDFLRDVEKNNLSNS